MNKTRLGWFACGPLVALCLLAPFQVRSSAQIKTPPAKNPPSAQPKGVQSVDPSAGVETEPITVNQSEVEWLVMVPQMGKESPVRAVLHEHRGNHSSQFLIRMPPNFHVPAHFHSANETHTVIEGIFIIEAKGKRVALSPGGFNYTPAQTKHEAWTPRDQGALIFVTIDGPYDLLQAKADMGQPVAGR